MRDNKITIKKGFKLMSSTNVAICSIVRDCEKSLKRNIPIVEKLQQRFQNSQVIIFENDSTDGTKDLLKKWNLKSKNVFIESENISQETIPSVDLNGVNKYFSEFRISKMVKYRNKYLKRLNSFKTSFDYVIVIDLDIEKFSIDGIAHSFGLADQWDVVTANGYSYSSRLQKRYHDTYALVEVGDENIVQDEQLIFKNQKNWSFLKKGMPLIPVYSAFGGLAIYKYDLIKNIKYEILPNYNDRVEVKCEHISLHKQIQEKSNKIFVNPFMEVRYQSFSLPIIVRFLKTKLQ